MRDNENPDADAIRRMTEDLKEAYVARDLERFIAFFADDVVCMPPGLQPITGRKRWRSWLQEWWGESKVDRMILSTDEVSVVGDWAFERHHETQVKTPRKGGKRTRSHYKGVWILRRESDGLWKIARYIWNTNPAPDVRSRT